MANDYWKKRIETEQLAKMERGATLGEEMDRLYSYHFNELEKEIRAFEQRYADKNGLSFAEVKARVDDFDVKAFEEKAKRYVAEKNFSARANSELALYNLKMKTNRLALLQYQLDLELVALADGERQLTDRFLNDEFIKAIETQSGLLGQSVLSASQIKTVAQSVLNTPFEDVVWSERIWQRQNALREVVARMTERLLLQGNNPTTMIAQLRKEFNVTASEAKRLAVTEGARVSTEGQKQAYIANEIDEYEFIAEPSACPNCAKKDGKIFKVEDMIPGENAAPMHPWCHCSTGAHAENIDKINASSENTEQSMKRLFRNKDQNKRRPVNITRQNKLTKDFRKRGGVIWQDDESESYLRGRKASAMNLNADTIVLQKKATISEILEELFHAEQWRDGRLVDTPISKIKAEIEAQNYLLSVEKRYNIPRVEIEQTKRNLQFWREELKKYEN